MCVLQMSTATIRWNDENKRERAFSYIRHGKLRLETKVKPTVKGCRAEKVMRCLPNRTLLAFKTECN